MTRKKTPQQRKGRQARTIRNQSRHRKEPSLADDLLSSLARQPQPMTIAMLLQALSLPKTDQKNVDETLQRLVKAGKVNFHNKRYRLVESKNQLRATLDVTAGGFAFATVEGEDSKAKDVFIPAANLHGASHGDTVLLKITGTSRGRREGSVAQIEERAFTRLCGIYMGSGKGGYVTPDNDRLPYTVLIRQGNLNGAKEGLAVLVDIIDYGSGRRGPEGKVIEVLGDPLTVPVQIRMGIEQFKLPRTFPKAVLAEAASLTPITSCDDNREDLRHVPHVTIDGADAKDFDDAIAVTETANGFKLHVSIADVGAYIRPGSALDREAYLRGTSVYLPDLVLPMLPERLSNNLCSLVPDKDRPAFTAILEYNKQGKRIAARFTKSMITSHRRFTYAEVNDLVYRKDTPAQKKEQHLLPMLKQAALLAKHLHQQRIKRGSLGFNIPQAMISLADDHIAHIGRAERNEAHQLVEECMLAANEAVAETLHRANRPVLYRVHERPDPAKVEAFTEAAKSMGMQLPATDTAPAWFAAILRKAHGSLAEYVINNLLLRTMQQARYVQENLGHFGLAADYYLHFTSPIRRYPDLIAHRSLQAMLTHTAPKGEKEVLLAKGMNLEQAGLYLSKRERIAIDADRNVQARLSTLFLSERLGEEFTAIISGVSSFGLFVELLDFFISGAIPIKEMRDDYYLFDSRAHRLIGEASNIIYQLGNLVQVRLEHVDMIRKRLTFSLLGKKSENEKDE